MKIARIEDLHCDAGWRTFSFLKITTDDGLVGWSEYTEADGSRGLTAVIHGMAEALIGPDPRPGAGHRSRLLYVRAGAGAQRRQPARHRRDRERPARHQGQGPRRAGLRIVRRPGAHAASRSTGRIAAPTACATHEAGRRAAAAHLRRRRRARRRGEAPRLQGAEDQHPAVRRREAGRLRPRLRPHARLSGTQRRPQHAAGGARHAGGVPRGRRAGDGHCTSTSTTISRPRATCRSPRPSRRST